MRLDFSLLKLYSKSTKYQPIDYSIALLCIVVASPCTDFYDQDPMCSIVFNYMVYDWQSPRVCLLPSSASKCA